MSQRTAQKSVFLLQHSKEPTKIQRSRKIFCFRQLKAWEVYRPPSLTLRKQKLMHKKLQEWIFKKYFIWILRDCNINYIWGGVYDSGWEAEEACGAERHRRLESHCQFPSGKWISVSVSRLSSNSLSRDFLDKGEGQWLLYSYLFRGDIKLPQMVTLEI